MNEKTFKRMTAKRPSKRFSFLPVRLPSRYQVFRFLSKLKLVSEVYKNPVHPVYTDHLNELRLNVATLTTSRGKFSMSVHPTAEEHCVYWFFRSNLTGKIWYTVDNSVSYIVDVDARVQCEEFEARFHPLASPVTVKRSGMVTLCLHEDFKPFALPRGDVIEQKPFEVKTHTFNCNLLNARLGLSEKQCCSERSEIDSVVDEIISHLKVKAGQYLQENAAEINQRITGVPYDGEMTYKGQTLAPNILCRRCGFPVFTSSLPERGYRYQCLRCDEDFYGIEVERVDPEKYNEVMKYCREELYALTQQEK